MPLDKEESPWQGRGGTEEVTGQNKQDPCDRAIAVSCSHNIILILINWKPLEGFE